ncbi:tyrosine-type recombinase/integrase [Candidatus Accumulibacter phosphatis]|uniref:tyrosine-type recombinase/integrase n=1 Tax=Candidatus Accumulibacter phosphatis TaxID=327160 RepID=UPI0020BFA602|nr:tyrosine-type recombinase/integrase [Candidatus Accumulibacter phosphatis]
MSARIGLQTRVDGYLAERHRLGFELHSQDTLLADFAKFVADRHHHGPLTVELMVDWVRKGKGGLGTPETWYRRMAILRRFVRYLQQFEPQTEIPEESIFGPEPGRVAPHIYREEEIVDLLAAAHKLGPRWSLRPASFETLFGLMASTGLRVSEAIHLRDADVDLKRGMLIVRQTKFAKSRQLPLPPSTVEALARATGSSVSATYRQRPTPRSSLVVGVGGWDSRSVIDRSIVSSMRYGIVSTGSIGVRMPGRVFMIYAITPRPELFRGRCR